MQSLSNLSVVLSHGSTAWQALNVSWMSLFTDFCVLFDCHWSKLLSQLYFDDLLPAPPPFLHTLAWSKWHLWVLEETWSTSGCFRAWGNIVVAYALTVLSWYFEGEVTSKLQLHIKVTGWINAYCSTPRLEADYLNGAPLISCTLFLLFAIMEHIGSCGSFLEAWTRSKRQSWEQLLFICPV